MKQVPDAVSPRVVEHIGAVCDRFARDWKAGRKPRIEDYLTSTAAKEGAALLGALLGVEMELLGGMGSLPSPAHYLARFPEHTAVIQAVFRERGSSTVSDSAVRLSGHGPPGRCRW